MKKIEINKNKVYITVAPPIVKHSLVSIIPIQGDLLPPIASEAVHESIIKLSEISDIIFVFPTDYSHIDPDKFTSLYNGIGWIISDTSVGETIFDLLGYIKEIFSSYRGVAIVGDLGESGIEDKLVKNIVEINNSKVSGPIMNIVRASKEKLWDRFSIQPLQLKLSFWKRLFKKEASNIGSTTDLRYCNYDTTGKVLYFGMPIVDQLLSHEGLSDYLKTFSSLTNPLPMFASYIKVIGLSFIDSNIEDLEINKLK